MYAQVHPIFVLSIADLMLAMLWLLGGGLWLWRDVNMSRVWCFSASLMTVVSSHCIYTYVVLWHCMVEASIGKLNDVYVGCFRFFLISTPTNLVIMSIQRLSTSLNKVEEFIVLMNTLISHFCHMVRNTFAHKTYTGIHGIASGML